MQYFAFSSLITQHVIARKCSRYFSVLHRLRERHEPRESNVQARATFSQAIKVSHMVNPGNDSSLVEKNIGQIIGEAVARWSARTCVVSSHQNIRLTYSELLRRVDSLAAGFKKLGLKRGDRLGIWGPNDLEWLLTALAAWRAGLIVVAINHAYQQSEVEYCLQKVGTRAIVSPATFKTQNYPKMLLAAKEVCPILEHIIIYSPDHVTGTRRLADIETSATRAEVDAIAATQDEISCHDGCNIQFTSGSTGKSKATLISHRSLVNNSREVGLRAQITTENKICVNVPFFHAFALVMAEMMIFNTGCALVLEERSFDPVKTLQAVAKEKCTTTYGTPTMWVNLIEAQQRLQLPTDFLKMGVIGGASSPAELFKRIRGILRVEDIISIYGLTETTAAIFQSFRKDDARLVDTTVGHLGNYIEAMVVDKNGSPVPFGVSGELWVRGYCNMLRYWDDEENTRKTLTSDNWLKTGDRFVLQENGYGAVVGRLKDMVIRGGENIFPKEIEDFLITHPKILEAHVIGAYDPVFGEELCACVQLRGGEDMTKDELRNYCRGKIAHFKIPRYVEFVNEYPKTTSGKIQKNRLREQMESRGLIPTKPQS